MKSEWQWMINVQLQQKIPRGNPFPPAKLIEYLKRRRAQ
jgi:hypothetical protein